MALLLLAAALMALLCLQHTAGVSSIPQCAWHFRVQGMHRVCKASYILEVDSPVMQYVLPTAKSEFDAGL